jgi:hypothetical protein
MSSGMLKNLNHKRRNAMHKMVEKANKAIQEPEVQDMLRRLSAYGLGIFMPHMHTDTEEYVPLPRGMVQVESNLQVSFQPVSEARGDVVGWVWDEQLIAASVCQVCKPDKDDDGKPYHKKLKHKK